MVKYPIKISRPHSKHKIEDLLKGFHCPADSKGESAGNHFLERFLCIQQSTTHSLVVHSTTATQDELLGPS